MQAQDGGASAYTSMTPEKLGEHFMDVAIGESDIQAMTVKGIRKLLEATQLKSVAFLTWMRTTVAHDYSPTTAPDASWLAKMIVAAKGAMRVCPGLMMQLAASETSIDAKKHPAENHIAAIANAALTPMYRSLVERKGGTLAQVMATPTPAASSAGSHQKPSAAAAASAKPKGPQANPKESRTAQRADSKAASPNGKSAASTEGKAASSDKGQMAAPKAGPQADHQKGKKATPGHVQV